MKDSKALLQHKLLNIITVLNIWFEEKDFKDLERPTSLLKLAGLIVAYEKAFLGQKFEFFVQTFSVTDIIKILISSHKNSIDKKNIIISNFENNVTITSDRYYFSEAINQIFTTLLKNSTSFIKFTFDEKTQRLIIEFDCEIDKTLLKKELISSLDQKDINIEEIGFLLAVHILKDLGETFKMKKNKISIDF